MWQQSHRILFNLHIRTCAHVFDYSPAKTDFPSCLPTITATSCICLSSQCKFFLPHCSHRPCTFSTLTTPRSLLDYTSIVAINSKPVIGRMAHVLHIHFTVLVTCCLATTLSLPISQFLLLRWLWSALTRYVCLSWLGWLSARGATQPHLVYSASYERLTDPVMLIPTTGTYWSRSWPALFLQRWPLIR